jgi:hypothetical protein
MSSPFKLVFRSSSLYGNAILSSGCISLSILASVELRQSFCDLEGHLQFISAAFTASYEKGFLFREPKLASWLHPISSPYNLLSWSIVTPLIIVIV